MKDTPYTTGLTEEDYMPSPTIVLRGSKVNTYDRKQTKEEAVHLSEPLCTSNRKEERPMATERIL